MSNAVARLFRMIYRSGRSRDGGGLTPLAIPSLGLLAAFLVAFGLTVACGNAALIAMQHGSVGAVSTYPWSQDDIELNLTNWEQDWEQACSQVFVHLLEARHNDLLRLDKDEKRKICDDLLQACAGVRQEDHPGRTIAGEKARDAIAVLATLSRDAAGLSSSDEAASATRLCCPNGPKSPCQALEVAIAGYLSRDGWNELWLFPQFARDDALAIVDRCLLGTDYQGVMVGEEAKELHSPVAASLGLREDLLLSLIRLMRKEDSAGLWSRRIQTLAGWVQWLTFFAAVWLLVLTCCLRLPWARIQRRIILSGSVPGETNALWDLKPDATMEIAASKLERRDPGVFLGARLVHDVALSKRLQPATPCRDVIRERVRAMREAVDFGEYELLYFLLSVIPSLGFIGTIVGIILAMAASGEIVGAVGPVKQALAIGTVGKHLATAFDTTLIALIWGIICGIVVILMRQQEINLFELLETEACKRIPPIYDEPTTQGIE